MLLAHLANISENSVRSVEERPFFYKQVIRKKKKKKSKTGFAVCCNIHFTPLEKCAAFETFVQRDPTLLRTVSDSSAGEPNFTAVTIKHLYTMCTVLL